MHNQAAPAARNTAALSAPAPGLLMATNGVMKSNPTTPTTSVATTMGANTSRARCCGSSSPCHFVNARCSPWTNAPLPASVRPCVTRAWYGEEGPGASGLRRLEALLEGDAEPGEPVGARARLEE